MKTLTDFRKTVETGVDPHLHIWHYDARATAHVDIREIKIHVYGIRQTSVENFSE